MVTSYVKNNDERFEIKEYLHAIKTEYNIMCEFGVEIVCKRKWYLPCKYFKSKMYKKNILKILSFEMYFCYLLVYMRLKENILVSITYYPQLWS